MVDVGGGPEEVDGDVVGGEETGEVQELVEVALGGKGHQGHHHFGLFYVVSVVVLVVVRHFESGSRVGGVSLNCTWNACLGFYSRKYKIFMKW